MVLSFEFDGLPPIELDDYVDQISTNYDVFDEASLIESTSLLHRLSLDRTLLAPVIGTLKEAASEQVQLDNNYTDATFMLAAPSKERSFFVRMNAWKVPRARGGKVTHEAHLYSYDRPHDHNFDFVTVGYGGPGYSTKTYEYDHDRVEGYIGEPVDLTFIEETSLPRGKVMFYRKSKDVHTQKPPVALSLSINLMVMNPDRNRRQQYFFDTDQQIISGYAEGGIGDRVGLIELAPLIGDNAIEPLLAIARRHFCPRTRGAATRILLGMDPAFETELWSIAMQTGCASTKRMLTDREDEAA